jgi:hypothetical protein
MEIAMCCLVDEDLVWCLLHLVHRKSSHSVHQVAALVTSNKTIFQDGCSYACTLLLAIVYVWCFLFRNVDMATATTQCCYRYNRTGQFLVIFHGNYDVLFGWWKSRMVPVTVGTQKILTFPAPGGRQFRFVVMITDVAAILYINFLI